MELGLGPGDFVFDGDPTTPTQFLAHVYCGQTAEWMKTPLGTWYALVASRVKFGENWKLVKYNNEDLFTYLYFFIFRTPTGRISRQIFQYDGSRDSA